MRTTGNELMRVTQQDREPLQRGQQVLLIMGNQARVVPDYTMGAEGAAAAAGPNPGTASAPDGRRPRRRAASPPEAAIALGAAPLARARLMRPRAPPQPVSPRAAALLPPAAGLPG